MRQRSIRVRIRLSKKDITLIAPTFKTIMAAEAEVGSKNGIAPFRDAWSRLIYQCDKGNRVRLDYREVSACMFAVRHTATQVNHGHLGTWLQNQSQRSQSLLDKLERHRRRARRLFEKRFGAEAYRLERNAWVDVLLWLVQHYLACPCQRHKGWPNLRRWYRTVLDRATALAAEGLLLHKCYPPPTKQLRRMVRHALRSIRRGRAKIIGIRSLLENPDEGADFLAGFLLKTRGDQFRYFDISTVSAEKAERLRALVTP